jgi:NCS1 family nucleobase:cation symporter-1
VGLCAFVLLWFTLSSSPFILGYRWDIIAVRTGVSSFFCFCIHLTSRPGIQNAAALLSFLSGYSWYVPHATTTFDSTLNPSPICSFMGPLAGVMCSDYYLVRKGKYNIGELYNPNGLYRYNRGWNWRAFVAFLYVANGHVA